MIRRHKTKRVQEQVTLNLAAMLDMAFQLLAFFILTFRPSPAEAELKLNLPRPENGPIVAPIHPQDVDDRIEKTAASTLTLTVVAARDGQVESVSVGLAKLFNGPLDAASLRQLDRRLKGIFEIAQSPFDQVLVRVDRKLHYGELMRIIDVCTRQKTADGTEVSRISFVEVEDK
jgi:biopolymer transport protein ExbD